MERAHSSYDTIFNVPFGSPQMHSPFPDVHLPLFVARLQSINLSISSARSSASHQSSSSNSRMELLLAGLYTV